MLKVTDLTPQDPVFSHFNEETNTWTHIAAARLAAKVDRNADLVRKVNVDEALYQRILTHNGVEQPHVDEWKIRYLQHDDPGKLPLPILIEWEDGHHTLADGNHRLCALYQLGIRSIIVYLVPAALWRQFEVQMDPLAQAILNIPGYMDGTYSHLRKKD
jgi:hypothetical protein